MKQIYIPKQDYKVLVRCLTYNQSKYIEDALNGFAMQKTDFPFVCLVMDDCSTDGEQAIIDAWMKRECDMENAEYVEIEYSRIILVPHKTNKFCTFAFYLLKKNLYGNPLKQELIKPWRDHCEYEAICEGDDYWIDSLKLQKQVDWMDSHSEYTLCCSDALILTPDGELDLHRYEEDSDVQVEKMILHGGGYIQTATILYRNGLLDNYPDYCRKCHVGDRPLYLWAALNGKVRYLAKKKAVYRHGFGESWTVRQRTTPIEELIKGWRTDFALYKGLDEYSHHEYHSTFVKTQARLLKYIISTNKDWTKKIIKEFDGILYLLDWKDRYNYIFISKDMTYCSNFMNIYIREGLKAAIYSLPILNVLMPFLRKIRKW